MKCVVLVPDGAADYQLDELGGRTPLQAARTPNMDRLASEGANGLVQMIPATCHPGSDIGNLEIFGYDSTVHYSGRAPLEAASMGIDLGDADIAFRCNLINRDGDTLVDGGEWVGRIKRVVVSSDRTAKWRRFGVGELGLRNQGRVGWSELKNFQ